MKRSISGFVRKYLLIISCSIVVIITMFSIGLEIFRFREESDRLKNEILEERKEHIRHQVESAIAGIEYLRGNVKDELQESIKQRVDEAYKRVVYLYETFKSKKSDIEIQEIIKASLRKDRFFNNRGYYYIFRTDGLEVLVPTNTKFEGHNMLLSNPYAGYFPIKEIIKKLENNDNAFVSYKWQKSDTKDTKIYDKTGYVRKLPFYNWIIGSGDYIEDVEKEIQERAILKIKEIKYDDFGYVFVNTFDGKAVIISSDKYKRGDDIRGIVDPDGVHIFEAELNQAKNKEGGFLFYKWYEPSLKQYKDNLSFVKAFPKWNWMIGAFTDISHINKFLATSKKNLYLDLFKRLGFILLFLFFIIFIVILLSRYLKKRLDIINTSFFIELKQAIEGKRKIDVSKFVYNENIYLSEQANIFLENQYKLDLEVKRNQDFLQTLIDSIPLTIFYKDINGIYLGCNKYYSKFMGIEREDMIGRGLYEIFPKEKADFFKKADDELFASKGIQVYDTLLTGADGKLRNVNFHKAVYLDENGEVAGMLGLMIDITERIEFQNKIKESEANLIQLNNTKDRFFSIIAHDLKNPFNSLMGLLEILIEEYDDLDDDTKKQYLRVVNKSSKDLFLLLTNLLEWSRTQTSSIEFNPSLHNLSELIKNQVKILLVQAKNKDIILESILIEKIIVFVDLNMMSTVVRNIISNAIKFTPKGGKIKISVKEEANLIKIYIEDNGVGISKQNIDKLFKISEKVSSVGTDQETGTGLGLILCKEFIDKHNGFISVSSEEARGSTFCVQIPK